MVPLTLAHTMQSAVMFDVCAFVLEMFVCLFVDKVAKMKEELACKRMKKKQQHKN